MSDRYQLSETFNRLRAALCKAERTMPLSQPLRSWDLYNDAIAELKDLTTRMQARIDEAKKK